MGDVIITYRVRPTGTDVDLDKVLRSVSEKIKEFGGRVGMTEKVPLGFGIVELNIVWAFDERRGSSDELDERLPKEVEGVESVDVIGVSRALG